MQIRSKFVVSVVSLLGAVACGDEDGDSGGGGTGGVSSTKKVGELSEAEARTLCRSLQTKFAKIGDAQLDLSCTLQSALTSGGNASTCQTAVDKCKTATADEDLALDCDGADGETGGVSSDCDDVTVGELNDCVDASSKALTDLSDMITCSTNFEDLGDLGMSMETPPACAKIEAKCPDIADMDAP